MSKQAEASPVSKDVRVDVLKAFLDQKTAVLNNLSERSFTTSLQAITLNVIVVAAMASGKADLSMAGKWLGSIVLVAFNASIAWYLFWKAKSHHATRSQLWSIEQSMAHAARLTQDFQGGRPTTFWQAFRKGSGVMIFGVLVAGACAVCGLWMSLSDSPKSAATRREGISRVSADVPNPDAAMPASAAPLGQPAEIDAAAADQQGSPDLDQGGKDG